MAENIENVEQKNDAGYLNSYSAYFRSLADKYGDLPMDSVRDALGRAATFQSAFTLNPFIQNRRVKRIGTLPNELGKDKITEMLQKPYENEQGLREVSGILEYTAYPYYKIRTTYQNLMTYHYATFPQYIEKGDVKKGDFMREWRMVRKFVDEMQPRANMRKIVGQCARDGKVFYVSRYDVDKSHNSVRSAFLQQLPQDWTKIVGFNNISRYTVAFNMFYFLQPGTNYKMFGDLFEPFIDDFLSVFERKPEKTRRGVIFASQGQPVVDKGKWFKMNEALRTNEMGDQVEMGFQNGQWFYWVYLPYDKVWTFEIDDVKPAVVSPFTGLFISMEQIAQYEQVQLEIVQNPLVSMVLGQIETYDSVSPTTSDPMKVSPTARTFFENLFYATMEQNNTGGVGIYSAPFKDMKLVQLAEAPNANKISSAGYEYALDKSGLSAIIPTTSEARAGVAQISLKLESQFARHMYWQFERMMNTLIECMGLKYDWKFIMFGTLAEDEQMRKDMLITMQRGILPDTIMYNALMDRSVLDDLSMSVAVQELGITDLRMPLVTSYSASNQSSLPPKGDEEENPEDIEHKGGRPKNDGDVMTDGNEQDMDDAKGMEM